MGFFNYDRTTFEHMPRQSRHFQTPWWGPLFKIQNVKKKRKKKKNCGGPNILVGIRSS